MAGAAWLMVPGAGGILATLHQPVVLGSLAAALVVGWFVAGGPRRRADDDELPDGAGAISPAAR